MLSFWCIRSSQLYLVAQVVLLEPRKPSRLAENVYDFLCYRSNDEQINTSKFCGMLLLAANATATTVAVAAAAKFVSTCGIYICILSTSTHCTLSILWIKKAPKHCAEHRCEACETSWTMTHYNKMWLLWIEGMHHCVPFINGTTCKLVYLHWRRPTNRRVQNVFYERI